MIPIGTERDAMDWYVSNVVSVWSLATSKQAEEGRGWYARAHETAAMLADGDVRVGAGVLAALSPQTSWWQNVELAADALETGRASRHTGDSCSKANRIMAGEDPVAVLPMQRKTGHFFRSILNPSDPTAICVDRHAHDAAVGVPYGSWTRGLDARGRYALISHAYWEAAQQLGQLPSTVQAVVWVAWRERLGEAWWWAS